MTQKLLNETVWGLVEKVLKQNAKCGLKCAISILAGGLSTRMGRDKAHLRLGSKTLLEHIRREARSLGLPVRIIRRDLVPRCGPLGGIYTALKTSRTEAELFLACDMPFVSAALLDRTLLEFDNSAPRPIFTVSRNVAGFPFLLPVRSLAAVEKQILKKQFSLQSLARRLKARLLHPPLEHKDELFNVNTLADWQSARQRLVATKAAPS